MRPFYIYPGNHHTGKTSSLYWYSSKVSETTDHNKVVIIKDLCQIVSWNQFDLRPQE